MNLAREKTDELDRLFEQWIADDPYAGGFYQDRKGRLVSTIVRVKPIYPRYTLLAGETAHQLRSALDHLAFALAKPSAKQERFVGFPLASSRKRFDNVKKSALVGVPRGVVGIVESVQPYHRRRWPETRYLGLLQALDNWSKHKAIPIAAARSTAITSAPTITGSTEIISHDVFNGWIKPGQIISRMTVGRSEEGAVIQPNINIPLYPAFDIGMPDGLGGAGVRGTLSGAGAFIQEQILPRFERFF